MHRNNSPDLAVRGHFRKADVAAGPAGDLEPELIAQDLEDVLSG